LSTPQNYKVSEKTINRLLAEVRQWAIGTLAMVIRIDHFCFYIYCIFYFARGLIDNYYSCKINVNNIT
jgi:hypothetical protein